MPKFEKIFYELLEGESLPRITSILIFISNLFGECQYAIITILIFEIIFVIWLYSDSSKAQRTIIRISEILPVCRKAFFNLSMARLSSIWSSLIKMNMPAADIFDIISRLIDDSSVSRSLKNVSERCSRGEDFRNAIELQDNIDGIIKISARRVPENELAVELGHLADIYREKASMDFRKSSIMWEAIFIFLMFSIIGSLIIGLFMPLIAIINKLGG